MSNSAPGGNGSFTTKVKKLHLALEEGKMKVKKVLSLLTLIFLIFFLVIPAFSGDDPTDADPWNETVFEPDSEDVVTVIIIIRSHISPMVPYFVFMKVNFSANPKITGGSSSTQAGSSSLAVR